MRIIDRQEIDMMDENSLNGAQQNVGVGQNRVNNGTNGDKIVEDTNNGNSQNAPQYTQYTIPGILHFIEHEWQRFQAERSQWDTDRAELQVSCIKIFSTLDFYKCKNIFFLLQLQSVFTIILIYIGLSDVV
jgi:Striatin family